MMKWLYVIKGSGQMFINGKWIDVKPGTFHFNPMNKVHATQKYRQRRSSITFDIHPSHERN